MSNYTTTLRYICEAQGRPEVMTPFNSYNINDYLTPTQAELIINSGLWTKDKLANKIVDNYYFREIGFETWGLFKHYAKIEMEKLMEHYLPLIYSRAIEYDPLVNVDYTESYTSTSTGLETSAGSSNSSSGSKSSGNTKFSDTPNVSLENVQNGSYLTNANFSDTETNISGNSTSTNTANTQGTNDYTKHIKGNSGVSATAQKMVEQFRDNIIAIDRKIIEELNPLFMGLY